MKEFLAKAKANISLFFEHVIAFPTSCMKVVTSGLGAIQVQVSTAKGAMIFLIVILTLADIFAGGNLGAIKFAIHEGTGLVKSLFDVLKEVGVGILLIVAVVWVAHLKKKA